MSNKHVAASGKRTGQWVTCLAPKGECPLGGHHVDEFELKKVQVWAGRRAFNDLNADDYKDYLKSKVAGTLEQDKRPMETLEAKKERLGKDDLSHQVKKKQPGTKLREAEKAAKDAYENGSGSISWAESVSLIFKDYPAVTDLPLNRQTLIQDYLEAKYGKWAPTKNYTEREKELRRIIENGDINNPAKLKKAIDEESKSPRQKAFEYMSTLPDAVAKKNKLDSKVEETLNSSTINRDPYRNVISAIEQINQDSQQPVRNKKQATPVSSINNNGISDYQPLNQGTATEAALLTQLQNYKGERGAFGKVSRKTRILEKLVHNQIVFDGTTDSYSFEKKSINSYAQRVESNINMAQGNIDSIEKRASRNQSNAKTLKVMEAKLDKYIADRERTETIEKNVHDDFVKASKKELITDLFRKGYDNSEHALQVASATKASEIYSLKKVIDKLVKRDEFAAAGL